MHEGVLQDKTVVRLILDRNWRLRRGSILRQGSFSGSILCRRLLASPIRLARWPRKGGTEQQSVQHAEGWFHGDEIL
jgi:hypothetical protein